MRIDRNIDAVWYNHHNPSSRTLAVRLHDGKVTVIMRDKPTDIWSPPIPMVMAGFHNKPTESTDKE